MSRATVRARLAAIAVELEACGDLRHRARERADLRDERDRLEISLSLPAPASPAAAAAAAPDPDPQPPLLSAERCDVCDAVMQHLASEALIACTSCGQSHRYLDVNLNAHGYDKQEPPYVYKRNSHFADWLSKVQGRETRPVPPDLLDALCAQARRECIGAQAMTPQVVRRLLKTTGHRKWYEHAVLIAAKLTGSRPPQLDAAVESKLKVMFVALQGPFENARRRLMPERKNFLSYSYCLYKMLQLLGLEDVVRDTLCLLKGRDKLYRQDILWRAITAELDWEFIPSV